MTLLLYATAVAAIALTGFIGVNSGVTPMTLKWQLLCCVVAVLVLLTAANAELVAPNIRIGAVIFGWLSNAVVYVGWRREQ